MTHHPKLFIATAPHYVSEVLDEVLQYDWARNSVACVSINFSNVARVSSMDPVILAMCGSWSCRVLLLVLVAVVLPSCVARDSMASMTCSSSWTGSSGSSSRIRSRRRTCSDQVCQCVGPLRFRVTCENKIKSGLI